MDERELTAGEITERVNGNLHDAPVGRHLTDEEWTFVCQAERGGGLSFRFTSGCATFTLTVPIEFAAAMVAMMVAEMQDAQQGIRVVSSLREVGLDGRN